MLMTVVLLRPTPQTRVRDRVLYKPTLRYKRL